MSALKKLRVTVDGRAFDVVVELLDESGTLPVRPPVASAALPVPPLPVAAPAAPAAGPRPAAGAGGVPSPLAGKVVSVDVKPGQSVAEGAQLLTLEAMKMNTFVYAPRAGTVTAVHVTAGQAVEEGVALVTLG